MKIHLDTRIKRNQEVLSGRIEEEIVLLDLDENSYVVINSVASRIWELIEEPVFFKDLIGILMDEYEIDEDSCKDDTIAFLSVLDKKGMIIFDE